MYDSVESKFGITDGENGIDEELAGNKRTGKKFFKAGYHFDCMSKSYLSSGILLFERKQQGKKI